MPPPRRDLSVKSVFYTSLVLRATAVGYSVPIEGNLIGDKPDVILEAEPFIASVIGGLHWQKRKFGVHVNWWLSSDSVDEDETPLLGDADSQSNFGTIMLEWRR